LASPADLAVVTEPTEITGTVDSDRLESWTLTSRPIGDGDAVTLATGAAPVSGGALATFDPTLLLNGLYELELTATDVQGQQVSQSIAVSVEGQMKIGHFTLSFVDLAIPVSGLDIEIVRTYDSRDKQPRDFGVGWSLDIRQGSYVNNRAPGDGWQLQTGFLPCDTVLETKSHLTVVRLSEQEVYRFALRLQNGVPSTGGGCFADAGFDFVGGPIPGATLEILGQTQVFYETGGNRVIDVDTLELYEPEDVRLTTRDGRIFELDLRDGVTRVEDLNGNRLSITPAGVTHSSGQSIDFVRDAEGRIEKVIDPLGQEILYAYDSLGDLVSVTDRVGATTRFTYGANHLVEEIENALGIRAVRTVYDDDGRMTSMTDASGRTVSFDHDLEANREVVTNRLGFSRVFEYDERGNMVRETDELGNVTLRTFDDSDNLLNETDPLGRTTSFTYTGENDVATRTDPLGNVTSYTYNSLGQPLTVTDGRGAVTINVYDGRGGLTQSTDALGNVTAYGYDPQGNRRTITDALGGLTAFTYDSKGNLTRVIDALGNERISTYDSNGNHLTETRRRTLDDGSTEDVLTTLTYDANGRVTATTDANGGSSSEDLDLLGRVTRHTDEQGRVTEFVYDVMGRLVAVTHPDETSESRSYDAEGRMVAQTNRAGETTTFTYDPAGRRLSTTFPDGATVSNVFDAAGQLVATTDARGNTTTFLYDAAGRRSTVIDALSNSSTLSFDANGNQTSITDARGHATTFHYDALNRLDTTTYADGTMSQVGHDALGRRVSTTDPAGVTTELGYDAQGRLATVTDALGQVTTYTYDELGNRLSQTDANGRTTRFGYDKLGRVTRKVLPDGAEELFSYHSDGKRSSHTDFNGGSTTFQYDANRRLIRKNLPDASEVTYTYTATGLRASVTDPRGTTTYAYDARDRLIELTYPDGRRLTYGWDAEGNRTSLSAHVAGQVLTASYAYDALNRLQTVTDPQGRVYQAGYDAVGNRASLAYPNGVETSYSYDALNRLTNLTTTRTAEQVVVQSYAYTLGPAGNRERIDEDGDVSRIYGYDDLYRLTTETMAEGGVEVYARSFGYDPVGNRLQQNTTGAGAGNVAYTYDERDRLLDEGGQLYNWDADGNLTGKNGEATYAWDVEDRLETVASTDGTVVTHLYDADGVRVRTKVTPPGGSVEVTDYLVDTSGGLSLVVAETDGSGNLTSYYVRGDDLLAVLRGFDVWYYHADGQGSIRALTDEAGMVTDRYSFEAFGKLLSHEGQDRNGYLFAGEPLDSTSGWYYLRARWMDPGVERFATMDDYLGRSSDPQSLHRYSYAHLDPVNKRDPTGRFTAASMVAIMTVAVMLAVIPRPAFAQATLKEFEMWFTGTRIYVYERSNRSTLKTVADVAANPGLVLKDVAAITAPNTRSWCDKTENLEGPTPPTQFRLNASDVRNLDTSDPGTAWDWGPQRVWMQPNGDLDDLCSPRRTTLYLHGGHWHHTHGCIKVSNSDLSWLIDNVVKKDARGYADLRVEYPPGSGFHK
ncbi:MAG: RHS repeat-associated core domain-containing protein, partial [Actinomycetia bacterium]|nr:RHS repeat-associated core domain-containing protein [Actinomycetes bacterium]